MLRALSNRVVRGPSCPQPTLAHVPTRSQMYSSHTSSLSGCQILCSSKEVYREMRTDTALILKPKATRLKSTPATSPRNRSRPRIQHKRLAAHPKIVPQTGPKIRNHRLGHRAA